MSNSGTKAGVLPDIGGDVCRVLRVMKDELQSRGCFCWRFALICGVVLPCYSEGCSHRDEAFLESVFVEVEGSENMSSGFWSEKSGGLSC